MEEKDLKLTPEMFKRIPKNDEEAELIARPSISFWQDAWRRFKKNKLAMAFLNVLPFFIM